jgi:hypothetical protein
MKLPTPSTSARVFMASKHDPGLTIGASGSAQGVPRLASLVPYTAINGLFAADLRGNQAQ